MSGRIRAHLRTHVIGYVALFVALSGTAYAANTVGSQDIINGEVKSVDIGNTEVKSADIGTGEVMNQDIADDAVDRLAIADDAVHTAEIGNDQVRSADVLDGGLTGADLAAGTVTPDKLATTPAAKVFNLASETTTTNFTSTLHADHEFFDTVGMHDATANTSDVVIPTHGIYMFTAAVEWDPSGFGFRRIQVRVDGAIVAEDAGPAVAGGQMTQNVSGIEELTAGQIVTVAAAQGSGGNLDARLAPFSITFVGPA